MSPLVFGNEVMYGDEVLSSFGSSRCPSALELLAGLKPLVVELRTKCDVLLLTNVLGIGSGSPYMSKNPAFDAVKGVLGVFDVLRFGGVV